MDHIASTRLHRRCQQGLSTSLPPLTWTPSHLTTSSPLVIPLPPPPLSMIMILPPSSLYLKLLTPFSSTPLPSLCPLPLLFWASFATLVGTTLPLFHHGFHLQPCLTLSTQLLPHRLRQVCCLLLGWSHLRCPSWWSDTCLEALQQSSHHHLISFLPATTDCCSYHPSHPIISPFATTSMSSRSSTLMLYPSLLPVVTSCISSLVIRSSCEYNCFGENILVVDPSIFYARMWHTQCMNPIWASLVCLIP